ncbi:TKL family protein kinase [Histomonas meleagridis]|uniref:TKL family protein kinase n=1 Tax=Histomonas meleagridis TaxID=135588 RepID=UPI00355A66B0|nr:TKL family protein kinase [Histomonas meleagridis]KAH0802230.1 TKL family protein kinase [Histomonas meleagridis]
MQPSSSVEELGKRYPNFVVQLDDFYIGETIGSGGFSIVRLGMQYSTGTLCAMKELKCEDLNGNRIIPYEKEISILSRCSDLFILKFIGFTIKYPFVIITEYIPGGSLHSALRLANDFAINLTGTQKTIISLGVAKGFMVLHKSGVIHHDLKSANILLDSEMLPIICDFGISIDKHFSSKKRHEMIGTPNWLAPEVFEHKDYDFKIDVYAYGMLLWEILTGSVPFKGKTNEEIEHAVAQKGQRPSIPIMTPTPLKNLINNCWVQDPKARPTFKEIYQMFAEHQVKFPDTDDKAINRVIGYIKKVEMLQNKNRKKIVNN